MRVELYSLILQFYAWQILLDGGGAIIELGDAFFTFCQKNTIAYTW